MNRKMQVYVNGSFCGEDEATVSVFDHGFLYGDGVFEGIRAYNGYIFRLKEHIERLYNSAGIVGIKIPVSRRTMMEICAQTFRKNDLTEGYIRLVVSRGVGSLGLDPRKCKAPSIIMIPTSYVVTFTSLRPLKVITSSVRRTPQFCVPASAKTLNYLNNILAKIEAIKANADEAVMLDWRGYISEGCGDNVFVVKNDSLVTPPLKGNILGGITRQVIIELANRVEIGVEERDMKIGELYEADEAFLTATGVGVHPIGEVDSRRIGTGEIGQITETLVEEFEKETLNTRVGYPIVKPI